MLPLRGPVLGVGGRHGSQLHVPPKRGGRRAEGPQRLGSGGGEGGRTSPPGYGTAPAPGSLTALLRGRHLKGAEALPPCPQRGPGQRPPQGKFRQRGFSGSLPPERMGRALSHLVSALHQSFPEDEGGGEQRWGWED